MRRIKSCNKNWKKYILPVIWIMIRIMRFESHQTLIWIMFLALNSFRVGRVHYSNQMGSWFKSCFPNSIFENHESSWFESKLLMILIMMNNNTWFKSSKSLIRVNCVDFSQMSILCNKNYFHPMSEWETYVRKSNMIKLQ